MTEVQIQLEKGRAQNALQDYVANKLYIPKIYLDAEWDGVLVDVLAIDRAGVGDVHTIRLMPLESGETIGAAFVCLQTSQSPFTDEIKKVPSHFRYVAIVSDSPETGRYDLNRHVIPQLFAKDGVGRIGILYVDLSQDDPAVSVILKPERFRSSKEILDLADKYVAEHTANWEIRE